MKSRSKRWCAKNGAQLKRNRRNRAKRRETTAAVRRASGLPEKEPQQPQSRSRGFEHFYQDPFDLESFDL